MLMLPFKHCLWVCCLYVVAQGVCDGANLDIRYVIPAHNVCTSHCIACTAARVVRSLLSIGSIPVLCCHLNVLCVYISTTASLDDVVHFRA